LKLAHSCSQKSDPLCPRLDHCDSSVRPRDGKRQPRKTPAGANVDEGRSLGNQAGHGEAVHDVLADYLSHRLGASEVDARIPLHQEATEPEDTSCHLWGER
jgi:hypothetical protein